MNSPELLDQAKIVFLKKLGKAKPAFFPDLVKAFITGSTEIVTELNTHPSDAKRIFQLGHKLKGMSGNLGALQLEELARQIEAAGQANQIENLNSLIEETAAVYKKTNEALQTLLGSE